MMWESLYGEFEHPSALYRGRPFWSWNGKLQRDELIRQVHVMKEMGFGGFFMHARTGLETAYLGEEWFAFINACADEAQRLGMEAWLYDEDRWPSGSAGGIVTVNPLHRMKYIAVQPMLVHQFKWSESIVAVFSASLEGLVLHTYTLLDPKAVAELDKDATILVFSVEEMQKSPFYNGYTYLDTLNRDATQHFIQSTHEKYAQHCGQRLGTSIKGIFTDEPHRGQLMTRFGSTPTEESARREWAVPWTYDLFTHFRTQFGYDLKERLPELFFWYRGAKISQVKWHFVELLQQLFLENFVKPLDDWSSAHKLLLTGHFLHENSLTAQTAMGGSMMRMYEYMANPGVDVLSESNRSYWIVKQLASVARQLGRTWLLSELYGCTGWQMSFEGHKAVGDWQALFGINQRCPHLSWYTMQGEAKRDYPASILHQSAWWKEYALVEAYFARIGVAMSQGQPVCDTLVISPLESVWCQVYPGWCEGLNAKDPDVQQLEARYSQVFHWLTSAQIDFDYGDEAMLSRMGRIDRDAGGQARLKVGEAVYRQVVVAGMTTIRASTVALLQAFMRAGGTVIFAGDAPGYVDALPSDEAIQLSERVLQVAFEQEQLVHACRKHIRNLVKIRDQHGNSIPDIFLQIREHGESMALMLLNVNPNAAYQQVTITIQHAGSVQEWYCNNGARYKIASSQGESIEFSADFPPGGEHLYIVGTMEENAELANKPVYESIETLPITGPFDYQLDEPNVLVLDSATYRIKEGEWQAEQEILKIDRRLRSHFGLEYRAGNMVQPWFAEKMGMAHEGRGGHVELCFAFHVDVLPISAIELAMERPEYFLVHLNGKPIDTSKQNGWWVDISLKSITIASELLVVGKNTLTVATDFHQGTDLEACYLLGNFGVHLDERQKHITRLPEQLVVGDVTQQGLPFYSGKIRYCIVTEAKPAEGQQASLVLGALGGACVNVNSQSDNPHTIAWQPYEADITQAIHETGEVEVEVVLTRRNTFGPLHRLPLYNEWTGPESFVTEGEHFTTAYALVPCGLLSTPKIVKKVLVAK